MSEYENDYLPDVSSFTDEEAYAYSDKVVDYIIDHASEKKNRLYASYESNYDHMYTALIDVAKKLNRTDGTNPMLRYDELCSKKYNFDSQCYEFRCAQRETALMLMGKGMAIVAAMEKGFSQPSGASFRSAKAAVSAAAKRIDDEFTLNLGYPASKIKAFPHKETIKSGATYISDVAVAGSRNAYSAKAALSNAQYAICDVDLNSGAGGYFVYIGYKVSNDPKDAVKDVFVENQGIIDKTPKKATQPSLCPVLGDQAFVNNYGDLNYDAGGNYLYLHQDKISASKKGLTKIWIDGNKPSSGKGSLTDLNKGAGGDYLYLHAEYADFETETGIVFDNDPEYYPFSYVLGAKVAIGRTSELSSQRVLDAALQKSDGSYRNWSEDEIRNFINRMGDKAWNEELKSAGLTDFTNRMAVDMHWDSNFNFTGKTLASGSNTFSTHNNEWVTDNLTYFKLYDYAMNKPVSKATEKPKEVSVDYSQRAANCMLSGFNKDTITIDVWDRITSLEGFGGAFQAEYSGGLKYMLSANYAIDTQGKVGQYVPETGCSYYTGNSANDRRAITIVLSSSNGGTRQFSEKSFNKLVDLVAYLCDHNGIKKLVWSEDKNARKSHKDGANITLVSDFMSNTDAPGSYICDRMEELVTEVNYRLDYVQ